MFCIRLNNCGLGEGTGTFTVQGVYRGDTGLFANIDSGLNCIPGHFPDGQNTVSWGPVDSANFNQSTHTGTLGITCIANSGGNMTEADIYLGSNVGMVDTLPANCTFQQDLRGARYAVTSVSETGMGWPTSTEISEGNQRSFPSVSALDGYQP